VDESKNDFAFALTNTESVDEARSGGSCYVTENFEREIGIDDGRVLRQGDV